VNRSSIWLLITPLVYGGIRKIKKSFRRVLREYLKNITKGKPVTAILIIYDKIKFKDIPSLLHLS
jgi:hypothetical protein